jgi:hypothetical protein
MYLRSGRKLRQIKTIRHALQRSKRYDEKKLHAANVEAKRKIIKEAVETQTSLLDDLTIPSGACVPAFLRRRSTPSFVFWDYIEKKYHNNK